MAALLCLSQASPGDEYQTRLEKLNKYAASKHYSLATYLTLARMHAWAREQYQRTIEYDPDHEISLRRLGFSRDESGAAADPSIEPLLKNEKEGREAERVRKEYGKKLEIVAKDLSRQWMDLARWCGKEGLEERAAAAYRRVIDYEPSNEGARKALGYVKTGDGRWLTEAAAEFRRKMKEGLTSAPKGEPADLKTEVEETLKLEMRERESDHFLLQSPHLKDEALGGLVRYAEHAYAMYHEVFGKTDLFDGKRVEFVVLEDEAQHRKFVEAFLQSSGPMKALELKSTGTGRFPRFEQYQGSRGFADVADMVVHVATETLSRRLVEGPHHWLHEGMAYHFTRQMMGTARTLCVDLAGTSAGGGKSYTEAENWPTVCSVWVRDGKDPNLRAILKCDQIAELDGAETVKAWSLVDFLITEHRKEFLRLCEALGEGVEIEAAAREALGWSFEDLDARWRTYVRSAY